MKVIRELSAPTSGLSEYLDCVGDDPELGRIPFSQFGSGVP